MTEENTVAATLDGSALARVLGRLMAAKGVPANEEHALDLAERSGLDRETFRARLAGEDVGAGDLTRLAGELALSAHEMQVLALAYAHEEEREVEETSGEEPGRIPRPEEIVAHYKELPKKQRVQPLRCRAGSKSDNPCPREATTWMHPEDRDYPMCEEHARANELAFEAMDRDITESITADWLRIARAWGFEDLEQLAINAHESAKEEALKAEARASLAREIADAPRNADERPSLTREQDQKLRELMCRGDSLNDAYAAVEDVPEERLNDRARRCILAVLASERDKGWAEAHSYKEELGLEVIGSEKPQPESGAGERSCA